MLHVPYLCGSIIYMYIYILYIRSTYICMHTGYIAVILNDKSLSRLKITLLTLPAMAFVVCKPSISGRHQSKNSNYTKGDLMVYVESHVSTSQS